MHKAVRLLRSSELGPAYEDAWHEWSTSGEDEAWATAVGDRSGRRAQLMRRGEIRLVNLEPTVGAQANKRRPAVIVSNDGANSTAQPLGRGVITVVPVTSTTERIYPFQVLLPAADTGLDRDSKAQAEQIRSVAVERVGARVGVVPADHLAALDDAIRLHLAL